MKITKKALERAGGKITAPQTVQDVAKDGLSDVSRQIMENREILKAIELHTNETSRKVGTPAVIEMPAKNSAPMTYRFSVQRDEKGRIMEILATPVMALAN
jgi:hypothetical protein